MIVLFVVDTSGSMNQRTLHGLTKLDCAKAAIEHFLKNRGKSAVHHERYFLVTCADSLAAIKASWKSQFRTFLSQVKNLKACDFTSIGVAFQRSFDLLNLYRLQTGIDNYGKGRMPWFMEPAVVICLTDGGRLTSNAKVSETLTLPYHPTPGSELTKEPFRWDQRLYTIEIRFPGMAGPMGELKGGGACRAMCEVTGGQCWPVTSMKALLQCMDILSSKVLPGVVLNFSLSSGSRLHVAGMAEPTPPGSLQHTFVHVHQSSGLWPIPEDYMPHPQLVVLPPRTAHPCLVVDTSDTEPFILDGFPYDEYEIDASSPLALGLQHRHGVAWRVQLQTRDGGLTPPFGFLRCSRARRGAVVLVVLPYNFPELWPLLDALKNVHKMMPSAKWCVSFENYLIRIPSYYLSLLKVALKRFGAPSGLIPDHLDQPLSYAAANHMKKLKQQSKVESDRIASELRRAAHASTFPSRVDGSASAISTSPDVGGTTENDEKDRSAPTRRWGMLGRLQQQMEGALQPEAAESASATLLKQNLSQSNGQNAFDVQRSDVVEYMEKLRARLDGDTKALSRDGQSKFSVPISQMGNYQEVLSRRPTLRSIDPDADRSVFFGNPYARSDKAVGKDIDALDDGLRRHQNDKSGAHKSRKRRRTPRKEDPPSGVPKSPPATGGARKGSKRAHVGKPPTREKRKASAPLAHHRKEKRKASAPVVSSSAGKDARRSHREDVERFLLDNGALVESVREAIISRDDASFKELLRSFTPGPGHEACVKDLASFAKQWKLPEFVKALMNLIKLRR